MSKTPKYILIAILIFIILAGILAWQYLMVPRNSIPTLIPGANSSSTSTSTQNKHIALSVCEKIKDITKKDACNGIVNGNIEACEALPVWQKLDCYVSLGRRINNNSICDRLNTEGLRYECLARLTKDYEACRKATLADYCYYDVAIIKGDSIGCKNITDGSIRNKCYALLERTPGYCQKISEAVTKDDCYIQVAMLANDFSICQNVESDRWKDMCVAMVNGDIENLDCKNDGGYCEYLAAFRKGASVCEKLENGDDCYYRVGTGLLGIYPLESPRGW